jgi:hypothetical protein
MALNRTGRVLAAVVFLAVPVVATAATAEAATPISPPTITPLTNPPDGPYPVGKPVTLAFSEEGVGTAVAYEYTFNGGRTQKVSAPSGTASVQVTPTRRTGVLSAYAVAADGSVSGAEVDYITAFSPQPEADKDMNGDGVPDLLTVGGTAGLGPGLWLATGKAGQSGAAGKGDLNKPATDIGINGIGFDPGADGPYEFNGAQVITGQFFGDGFTDILVYFPSGNDAGGGTVVAGSGDGSAIEPFSGNAASIDPETFVDANGDIPLQVVNAYGPLNSIDYPDLLATSGDPVNGYYLDYYEGSVPSLYSNTFSIRTPTPDGTADWNQWTLATLSYSGGTGMFLWNQGTGALYLWAGVTFTDNGDGTGAISYAQYKVSSSFSKGQPLSTLEAADFDGDGVPDLWAVTPAGIATAYRISGLSATAAATITAGKPQPLS